MGLDIEHYCEVGECNSSADKAHLITRANLPKGQWDNSSFYIYLCRKHHILQHSIGIDTFCEEYGFKNKLEEARREYIRINL